MIDTLMAFWNQNRRKRVAQVLLTFFLTCISISLLFVAMGLPQWSHTHLQGAITRRTGGGDSKTGGGITAIPTVIVQITQGPETKPTSTVVVPRQLSPTPSSNMSACTTATAQTADNATTYPKASIQQATPNATAPQGTTPVAHKEMTPTPGVVHVTPTPSPTPSPTTVPTATSTAIPTATPTSSPTGTATPTQIPTETVTATPSPSPTTTSTATPETTPTATTSHGTPPHMPGQQLSGGGPINMGTPVSASPVPGLTPTGATQPIGGGWISACNGNDIGMATGADIVAILWQHMWLILGASLACTALFYVLVWSVKRKRNL